MRTADPASALREQDQPEDVELRGFEPLILTLPEWERKLTSTITLYQSRRSDAPLSTSGLPASAVGCS